MRKFYWVFYRFKRFLRLSRSRDIEIFLEQIFTSGIILNETAKTKSVQVHAIGYHVNKKNEGTLCESTIFFCFWVRVICWNFFLVVAKIDRCGLSAARVNGLKYTVHEIYNTWPQICLQCNSLHDDSMTISRVQWCLTCKYHRTISLSHGEAFSFHLWYSPNPSVRSQLLQHVFI